MRRMSKSEHIFALLGVILFAGVCLQQCASDDLSLSFMDEDDQDANHLFGTGIVGGEEEEAEGADEEDVNDFEEIDFDADEEDVNDFEEIDFDDEFESEEETSGEEEEELDEKDVVVLASGNFSEFVKSNHYVMVEFYAPWCGHCQMLAPEYAEAATILKDDAVLAKVDATRNDALSQVFGVEGYPTIFFFIDGVHKIFSGHRRKDEIVAWVKKKTGIPVTTLNSKEDAETMLNSSNATLAIALLNSLEGSEVEEYTSAARQEDSVLFFQTDSALIAEVFDFPNDVERPALVLLKQQDEKVSWFDGAFQRDAIESFVAKTKLPLVIPYSQETSPLIFESPVKKQVILFTRGDDSVKLLPAFKEASKRLIGRLVFVHVDMEESEQAKGIMEFFGLSGDNPTVMGYETQENGRKFLLEDDITAENIRVFGEDFLSNSLKVHYKSEPIPEKNDDDVKIVVGQNLDDIVLDETKDVFLEIYAPWCGHCQALERTWGQLSRRIKSVESIVIAKMDGTLNEHPRAKPDGYPTLLFYPAGKKSFDPITFDGDRTVKEFVLFLKREAGIPFTIPKKPSSQTKGDTANTPEADINSTGTANSEESKPESSTPLEPIFEPVIEEEWSQKDEL